MVGPTIIAAVVTTGVVTDVTIVGMTVGLPETTGMIDTTDQGSAVSAQDPRAGPTMTTGVQGLRLDGMMIDGHQGTRTCDAAAMMTADPLTIIMTVVGMTVVMTESTTGTPVMKIAHQGSQAEKEDGHVETV